MIGPLDISTDPYDGKFPVIHKHFIAVFLGESVPSRGENNTFSSAKVMRERLWIIVELNLFASFGEDLHDCSV